MYEVAGGCDGAAWRSGSIKGCRAYPHGVFQLSDAAHRKVLAAGLFCLYFFKVPTAADGLREYLWRMATKWNPRTLFDGSLFTLGISEKYAHVLWIAIALLLLTDWLKEKKRAWKSIVWLAEQCIWFRWLVMLGGIMAVVIFGAYGLLYDAEKFYLFSVLT